MRNKSLSSFGYIIESMGITISDMSASLHVDASLISKWKTGSRTLSTKSAYFDDILDYLMEFEANKLKKALLDLYPNEIMYNEEQLHNALYKALSIQTPISNSSNNIFDTSSSTTINVFLYKNNNGKRDAISKMLAYAEQMDEPGELTFIDNEQYEWLTDDTTFAEDFTHKIIFLVNKGFHINFVLFFTTNTHMLNQLFSLCNPLIFHCNISWYYQCYYDNNLVKNSIFTLNKAISIIGLTVDLMNPTVTVFTNPEIVLFHEQIAKKIIRNCQPLFTYFKIQSLGKVLTNATNLRKNGAFYSFLPSPTFLCSDEQTINDILIYNNIDSALIDDYLKTTNKIKEYLSPISSMNLSLFSSSFLILQLEELLERAHQAETCSRSLSLLCKQEIKISIPHYVSVLRKIIMNLNAYENFHVILVSHKDQVYLPNMNCFCKQNIWMIQMTKSGFRIGDEFSMVNAFSNMLEQYNHMVPSERSSKTSVIQFFTELIDEMEYPNTL